MTYLIAKILLCLLVAFLLGMLVGWYLFRVLADSRVEADTEKLRNDLDQSVSRQRTMETALNEYEAKIADLKDRLEEASSVSPVSVTEGPDESRAKTPASTSGMPRPLETDDLKRIKGVGPVIEKKLNRSGIRSFRQIAEMTSSDLDRMAVAIEFFPDRIRRDDWVGQAIALHRDKYGD